MATASVPYSFTNGTGQNADATQVNANYQALVDFLNNYVIQKDGSVSFTGIPTLPASDPTTANQAVRKSYVDTLVASVSGTDPAVGGDLSGTASNAQIVAGAVGVSEIAAAVAGSGLSGGGGQALAVNVDGSTIEINSDTLRVKDAGITNAKMSSGSFSNIKNIAASLYCGRATSSALQSLTSASTWRSVDLDYEVYDPQAMHSTSSNTQRVTISQAGFYEFNAYVRFTGTGSGAVLGARGLRLAHYLSNGTLNSIVALDQRYVGNTTEPHAICIAGGTYLSVGDYVDLQVFQDSGYTLNLLYDGDGVSSLTWHCVRLA